jgi:hypothetical protein
MEDKIPTAQEFLVKKFNYHGAGRNIFSYDELIIFAIEFAKLHVQAALKAADENAQVEIVDWEQGEMENSTPIYGVDSSSILNAYPLDKIK